jgi:endoglycosylceramidase
VVVVAGVCACAALLLALVLGLSGANAGRSAPRPAPVSAWAGAGFVKASGGRYLVDAPGRRLQLHGADLAAKCGGGAPPTTAAGSPCIGPAQGPYLADVLSPVARDPGRRFGARDAATLARLGFDFVRLGIVWEGLEPGPAGVGPNDPAYCSPHRRGTPFPALRGADPYRSAVAQAYLARTDRIIRLLAAAGIRVVLDMHQDVYGSAFANPAHPTPWNGEGAPPWATCTGATAFATAPHWIKAYLDPAVKLAAHHFFANDVRGDLQGQFARVWQAVARHYRHNPDVIGYEVYNEPADFAVTTFDPELQCFYGGPVNEPRSCAVSGAQAPTTGIIGAIQRADDHHLVLYEPAISFDNNGRETIGFSEPLRFPRLVLAFHAYGASPALVVKDAAQARAATRTRQPGGPALIMDEFGGSRHTDQAAATADAAGRLGISWSYWSVLQLHDPTGNPREALLDQQTRRPSRPKARALAVAYWVATAGVPGPAAFNRATGAFVYSYRVDRRVHAPTEIELPRWVYPRGYRVRVRGAQVVSAKDATVLLLSALPAAGTVSARVQRRSG